MGTINGDTGRFCDRQTTDDVAVAHVHWKPRHVLCIKAPHYWYPLETERKARVEVEPIGGGTPTTTILKVKTFHCRYQLMAMRPPGIRVAARRLATMAWRIKKPNQGKRIKRLQDATNWTYATESGRRAHRKSGKYEIHHKHASTGIRQVVRYV